MSHQLPAALGPLIARDDDLARVAALLGQNRLVTVTGQPGIGKSRLAVEVASAAASERTFVAVADLDDPTAVHEELCDAAPTASETGVLLLVDDCDHLIEETARSVDELLKSHPGLTVLATCREPLGIPGEVIWRLGPLTSAPEPTSAAVRLYIDRATAVVPTFQATPGALAHIDEICRALDGNPLAIELAAARADVLPPAALARRLGERFELLVDTGRKRAARHSSLTAALDWSHDRLPKPEAVLFRRLSVFPGGFTIEAATALSRDSEGDGGEPSATRALDLTARLVAKSLVATDSASPSARYRMPESIRLYACDKLDAAGEMGAVSDLSLRWLVDLAEAGERALNGASRDEWVERLDAEHDNIRAALGWATANGRSESALRLAAAMAMYWSTRGDLGEGRQWLESAIKHAGPPAPPLPRARALWGAGFLAELTGDYTGGRELLNESLALARQAGDTRTCARALMTLAVCALFIEDQGPPAALSLFQQASVLAREAADSWCLVCALSGVATVRNLQGDTSEARDILQQSLDIAKTAEDAEGIATAIGTLGAVALRQGDLATAEVVLAEGVNLARVLGDSRLAADSLLSLSNVALRHNDLVRARVLSEECLRLAAGVGYRSAIVSAYCQLGELARLQGDGGVARSYFTEALSVSWQVGSECPAAFLGLGRVSMDAGDVWAAEPLFNRCLAAAGSSVGNSDLAASALHELGSLSRGQGDNDRATDYHQQALRLRSQGRDPAATAESLETLGGLAIEAGAHDYGVRLLGAAQAVRRLSDNHRPPRRGGMGHDADVAAARESLTPEAFDKAWIEGEMLTVDEAVDIALAGVPETMGRPASGWESLTKSERVVSALVADNLTNREIGERLFISPRTVQTHLSHVFAKTGIADRRELARWVTRRRRRSNPLGESDYTDL